MNPKELELRYAKGIAAHRAGRIAEAEMIYAQILKIVPEADAVNTNMSALQHGKGNFERALEYVDKALKVNPLNVDALINRATTLTSLDRETDAILAFVEDLVREGRRRKPRCGIAQRPRAERFALAPTRPRRRGLRLANGRRQQRTGIRDALARPAPATA